MNIWIVLGWAPRDTREFEWNAPTGAKLSDALAQLQNLFPAFKTDDIETWHVAVWGKPQAHEYALKLNDRVEVLRGLRVDPKVARRERFQKQGSRAAGLFAKRRDGAKPGY